MREINREEFHVAFDAVVDLTEVFEIVCRPYHLEVLFNDIRFYGILTINETIINMDNMNDMDQSKSKVVYVEYDSLEDAYAHSRRLVEELLKRFSIA